MSCGFCAPVVGKLALCDGSDGCTALALRGTDLDQWNSRLSGEVAGDGCQPSRAGALHRIPQVLSPRVLIGMAAHVVLDPSLPNVGTCEALQHRQDGLAFLVGNRVESLVRHFMRLGAENSLAAPFAGDRGVIENRIFECENRAPILHRAEELRLAGAADVVELR